MVIHPYLKSTNNKSSFGQVSLFNGFLNDLNTLNAFQQQSLAQAQQQQQQQIAIQQLAIMETAIKKEIFELLSATQSQQNLALLAQRSQLLTHLEIEGEEEEGIDFVDFDFIEKQIAAQNNRLSAAEAEAVAVLAGLASFGNYQNK
uniref:Uncharacterized protein n=1 Tax=Meloidogyne javanica TaxID=6303 RepID=A0A915MCN7_MELJA